MSDPVSTSVVARLSPEERRGVADLVSRATETDGVSPLNEHARLALGRAEASDGLAHLIARQGSDLVGYAFLDSTTADTIAQVVVDPDARRRGVATAIVRGLGFDPRTEEGAARWRSGLSLRLWSFGDLEPARGFVQALGYRAVRELLIMERDTDDVPAPRTVDATIRAFTEADIPGVLHVNARAFTHHPEQAGMDEQDIRLRMAEPWFDPQGFLVATRPGADGGEQVVGFHWTKQHDAATGEVYVIAVDPEHSGGGLGRELLNRGLQHLVDRGVGRIILYVEGDQRYVVELYLSARFVIANRDVLHASPRLGEGGRGDR